MRKFFLSITFFAFSLIASSNSANDLDSIESLIRSRNYELAKSYALEAKVRNDKAGKAWWLTRSNLFLGLAYTQEQDYAKAIVYYLEGIRYSEFSNDKRVLEDRASLQYRCGAIFAKFKAYDLAEEYLLLAIEDSETHGFLTQKLQAEYYLSNLYKENKRYEEAISLLLASIDETPKTSRMYASFNDRLALVYREAGEFDKSIVLYKSTIAELEQNGASKIGNYHHNLAKSYKAAGDLENAKSYYTKAIELKSLENNHKSLFTSYFGLGETYFSLQDSKNSKIYFDLAEGLMHLQPTHPDYFELYKFCANLHYQSGKYDMSKRYEDLYSDSLNEYLAIQEGVQESEQRINIDLITKRYFADVKKQDRIAEIMFASQLTSGSLLTLLLLVIGYHRYQKVMLRKSIEKELISLRLID